MQLQSARFHSEVLKSRKSLIDEICRVSGVAGLSCGVIHDGEEVFKHHYGFRDIQEKTPCDDDTIYVIGSLTKAFTAAACAIAVEDRKLDWTTPIEKQLPGFKHKDAYIREKLTLEDILCQRSGLANPTPVWLGKNNEVLLADGGLIQTCNNLPSADEFRTGFLYNNFLYSLAGRLLGHIYGDDTPKGYINFLQSRIFEPLGLTRTSFDIDPSDKDVAKGYSTLNDGTLFELPYPGLNSKNGGVLAPCGGIRSSLRDMMKWVDALTKSAWANEPLYTNRNHLNYGSTIHSRKSDIQMFEKVTGFLRTYPQLVSHSAGEDRTLESEKNPPKCTNLFQMETPILEDSSILLVPHNAALAPLAIEPKSLRETSYALGWCRQSTPNRFSLFSKNREFLPKEIPLIAAGKPSFLTFSHIGSIPGFTSVAIAVPELQCSIVVLANAEPLGDVTDWVSQALLEAVVNPDGCTDFLELAHKAARKDQLYFTDHIECPYMKGKTASGQHASPYDFVGTYSGLGGTFMLLVQFDPSLQSKRDVDAQLILKIAGRDSQSYKMSYYGSDSWGFLTTASELKSQFIPFDYWKAFILRFKRDAGTICGLYWEMDEATGEIFFSRE